MTSRTLTTINKMIHEKYEPVPPPRPKKFAENRTRRKAWQQRALVITIEKQTKAIENPK